MKRFIAGMLAATVVLSMGGVAAFAEEAASAAQGQQTSAVTDTQDDEVVTYEASSTYQH